MKLVLLIVVLPLLAHGQMSEKEIIEHRAAHKKSLEDTLSDDAVLTAKDWLDFHGVDYFTFDSTFQLSSNFRKDKGKWFEMPTSTERLPIYRRYGYVEFSIDTTTYTLTVYQNKDHRKGNYKGYLFIPFRDGTSGVTTYGGGRYLDAEIPETNEITLDFNLAYNPYCAYSHRYSCPIPPVENTLQVKIEAGEKTPLGH